MKTEETLGVFWEKTKTRGARLLRVFGENPVVVLPEYIGEYPVTEIGDYCFAKTSRLRTEYQTTVLCLQETGGWQETAGSNPQKEIAGEFLEEIYLSENLQKIGNMAFYNCTGLRKMVIGRQMNQVGSDAFMNCRNFHRLTVACGVAEKSGIRQILSQISAEMEVTFENIPMD